LHNRFRDSEVEQGGERHVAADSTETIEVKGLRHAGLLARRSFRRLARKWRVARGEWRVVRGAWRVARGEKI
jgi:hypothetical protein